MDKRSFILYNAKYFKALQKEGGTMARQEINNISGKTIVILSLTALLAVLSGYTEPPQPDEGTGAHIFQLSILLLVPALFVFLVTANWTEPLRSSRPLALPAAVLAVAFAALYYLEYDRLEAPPPKEQSFSQSC
jgi:hypothetical protein